MCGRFLLDADYEALIERYKIFDDFREVYEKRDEIFPSQKLTTLINVDQTLRMKPLNWGLKLLENKLIINSRVEKILNSSFYDELKPCIIPATGYYEWLAQGNQKNKYKITTEESIFSMVGLWDELKGTVSIVTTNATKEIAHIHDRMPLIVSDELMLDWIMSNQSRQIILKKAKKEKTHKFFYENLEPFEQLSFFT